jgi:RNA polymerase sigma factor (sigma-70 family)
VNGVPYNPELLLKERAWLHALARHLVRPHEAPDELAQDTLAAALTQQAPHTTGLRRWLASILRKQLAGRRRAEHRRRARESKLASSPDAPPTLDVVARFEVQRDVGNAVLALAEPYRTTVLLRYWEELPPAAIGERLQIPVETVRTRLKRGLAQLRERLDQTHGGDRAAWAIPMAAALPETAAATATPLLVFAEVSLMTVWFKLLATGLATAAAVWFLLAQPWAAIEPPPQVEQHAQAPATAATAILAHETSVPSQPPPPAAERTAIANAPDPVTLIVTGTVIDDATSKPLVDVPVQIEVCSTSKVTVTGFTAADGTFTLRDTRQSEAELRQVVVQALDYAAARHDVSYEPQPSAPQTVDLGTLRLVRGTLFSGRVIDQQGLGVANAELLLPLESFYGGLGGPQDMLNRTAVLGHTDATGAFQLTQPIAPDTRHQNLLFAVPAHGLGWCTFEASKERRQVDDLLIQLRPTGDARVLVEDPAGRPVANARVRALPRYGPIGSRRGWRKEVPGPAHLRALFVGQTAQDGTFAFQNLPIGERNHWNTGTVANHYELWVDAEGYAWQALQPFDLDPNVAQNLTFRLVATREMTVTVFVRDDAGTPIPDALVVVDGLGQVQGRTNSAGTAELAVRSAPSLAIRATCANHREVQTRLALAPEATSAQQTVTLARTQRFSGRVEDQTGAPIPGAFLFLDQQRVGVADDQGNFQIEDFPMGERRVVVAIGPGVESIHWTGAQEPKDVDAAHGPVTFVLQRRPGSVEVRIAIVDAVTGQALQPLEAYLRLQHGPGYFFPKSVESALGIVTAKDTPAGQWQLVVRTTTGQQGALEFPLTEGQPPTDLRLAIPQPGTITGRLTFVGITPPENLILDVHHASSGGTRSLGRPGRWVVDPSGQSLESRPNTGTGALKMQPAHNPAFRLELVDPNDSIVLAVRSMEFVGETTVRVEPGQLREVVVEVRARAH